MTAHFDVAVVGLGAMGSAALAHLAARGAKVIGIDAFYPAHAMGSSHGDSRLIRLGYFEDPSYVPLLQRAYENWRALEARLRADILTVTGVLQIGRPDSKIVSGTKASCDLHGLAHEILDKAEMARRYPAFALEDGEIGLLDPQGGYIRPEAAIMGYLRLAAEDGAELHFGEKVTVIMPDEHGVDIRTTTGKYRARKVIVATDQSQIETLAKYRQQAQLNGVDDLVPLSAAELHEFEPEVSGVAGFLSPSTGIVDSHGLMLAYLGDAEQAVQPPARLAALPNAA